jgi:site-specific DNA-cytosine methylase
MQTLETKSPQITSLFLGCIVLELGFHLEGREVVWSNDNFSGCAIISRHFGSVVIYSV